MQPFFDNKSFRRRGSALSTRSQLNFPDLKKVLNELGPMPSEALFIGMANDGLPVLLNLHDSVPGPLLVVGDKASGKTNLIKGIAKGIPMTHSANETQYVVVTNNVAEWDDVADTPHMAAIVDAHDIATSELILSLAAWAHGNKSGQSTILLLDDLTNVGLMDFETRQNFRWLLLRGPSKKVWTIATGNSEVVNTMPDILETFKTRLYGNVLSSVTEEKLQAKGANLSQLMPGKEFKLKEGDKWLKFWIPS